MLKYLEGSKAIVRGSSGIIVGQPSAATIRLHAGGAMTCGYKGKKLTAPLPPPAVPAVRREQQAGARLALQLESRQAKRR
jgi:hypothetical protein